MNGLGWMIFLSFLTCINSIVFSFKDLGFFSNKMVFFHIDLGLSLFFLYLFVLFFVDILRQIVALSTVSFFMVFMLTL